MADTYLNLNRYGFSARPSQISQPKLNRSQPTQGPVLYGIGEFKGDPKTAENITVTIDQDVLKNGCDPRAIQLQPNDTLRFESQPLNPKSQKPSYSEIKPRIVKQSSLLTTYDFNNDGKGDLEVIKR